MGEHIKRYAVVTGSNKGIGFEKRGLQAFGLSDFVVFHQLDAASVASLADILVNNPGIGGVEIKDSDLFSQALLTNGMVAWPPLYKLRYKLVFWRRPSEDQVALNVDGSSYGNHGPAGYGGLIRNCQGFWIAGFSGHVNHADSLEAELLAIMHGLMLVWDYGYPNVSCITDCKNALTLIDLEPIFLPPKYMVIINSIQELISRDWDVSFLHTYREANQCADYMAKLGTKSMNNGFEIFTDIFPKPPTDLSSLLESDAKGTGYPRFY